MKVMYRTPVREGGNDVVCGTNLAPIGSVPKPPYKLGLLRDTSLNYQLHKLPRGERIYGLSLS